MIKWDSSEKHERVALFFLVNDDKNNTSNDKTERNVSRFRRRKLVLVLFHLTGTVRQAIRDSLPWYTVQLTWPDQSWYQQASWRMKLLVFIEGVVFIGFKKILSIKNNSYYKPSDFPGISHMKSNTFFVRTFTRAHFVNQSNLKYALFQLSLFFF